MTVYLSKLYRVLLVILEKTPHSLDCVRCVIRGRRLLVILLPSAARNRGRGLFESVV